MRMRTLVILSLLMVSLVVSGCAGPEEKAPVNHQTATSTPTVTPAPTGDVMDSEIATIEADMTELDALLEDMDSFQNMSFSELDGLNL